MVYNLYGTVLSDIQWTKQSPRLMEFTFLAEKIFLKCLENLKLKNLTLLGKQTNKQKYTLVARLFSIRNDFLKDSPIQKNSQGFITRISKNSPHCLGHWLSSISSSSPYKFSSFTFSQWKEWFYLFIFNVIQYILWIQKKELSKHQTVSQYQKSAVDWKLISLVNLPIYDATAGCALGPFLPYP